MLRRGTKWGVDGVTDETLHRGAVEHIDRDGRRQAVDQRQGLLAGDAQPGRQCGGRSKCRNAPWRRQQSPAPKQEDMARRPPIILCVTDGRTLWEHHPYSSVTQRAYGPSPEPERLLRPQGFVMPRMGKSARTRRALNELLATSSPDAVTELLERHGDLLDGRADAMLGRHAERLRRRGRTTEATWFAGFVPVLESARRYGDGPRCCMAFFSVAGRG